MPCVLEDSNASVFSCSRLCKISPQKRSAYDKWALERHIAGKTLKMQRRTARASRNTGGRPCARNDHAFISNTTSSLAEPSFQSAACLNRRARQRRLQSCESIDPGKLHLPEPFFQHGRTSSTRKPKSLDCNSAALSPNCERALKWSLRHILGLGSTIAMCLKL